MYQVNAFMFTLVCGNSLCIVLATNVNSRKASKYYVLRSSE